MPAAHEVWSQNVRGKVVRLQELVRRYLTNKEGALVAQIGKEVADLRAMFDPAIAPGALARLESALGMLQNDVTSPVLFESLFDAFKGLPTIGTPQNSPFEAIFDEHRKNGELQALLDRLVELLQRIVDEGDDTLSAQVERELRVFLEQLKTRDHKSLTELNCWVDLGVRTLFTAAQHYSGVPGLALLWDAAKLAARAHGKLLDGYAEAQKRLVADYKLKFTTKAVEDVPQIPSEQDVQNEQEASQKRLDASTSETSSRPA